MGRLLIAFEATFLAQLIADDDDEAVELLEKALGTTPPTPNKKDLKPQILENRKSLQTKKKTLATAQRTTRKAHHAIMMHRAASRCNGGVMDGYGTGTGRVRDGYGSGTGQVRDGYGTGTGQERDWYGTGTGRVRYGTGTVRVRDGYGTGTGRARDGYGTGTRRYGTGTRRVRDGYGMLQ